MHARVENIVLNGRSLNLSRFSRPVAVLISRRPGGQWATRNDRFYVQTDSRGQPCNIESQVAAADKEKQGWQAAEPNTDYKVVVCEQSDLQGQRYLEDVK